MKELTVNEVQEVSGGWRFDGPGAVAGLGIGGFAGFFYGGAAGSRVGMAVGARIGSVFDNIDYYQLGEDYKIYIDREIRNGNFPPD